jgi:hypothetical protein
MRDDGLNEHLDSLEGASGCNSSARRAIVFAETVVL